MPLMPADVAAVAFSKPPLGKRGYDEDEVDAFLDVVEAELARLIQENTDLRTRVESFEQRQFAAPVDTGGDRRPAESLGPPSPPPLREQTAPGGDYNVHAARVLGLAQEMADRLTGEAKAEADGMLSHARTKSEQLLSEARAKAEGMVTEARTRAETMLNDARTTAETLERQSRDKAVSLERDAAAKHTEVIAGLRQEEGILENKIDELRAFEGGYRTRLKTYLDSQLRELGGIGSAAPADPMHTQQGLVGAGFGAHAEAGSR
ncbi:MAG TPA: DivIVA domain-containing protein [Pseudonocardiaceae bacterium]|nr:DivIVA domain-containing protein [Pseudonocardiaceae bacterium]